MNIPKRLSTLWVQSTTRLKKAKSFWRRHKDNSTICQLAIHSRITELSNCRIMTLEILTPERKLFSGEIYGVQMPGISGSFEVLDRHAPLVSALKAGRVKVLRDKQLHTTR